jgi:hypothetical protein
LNFEEEEKEEEEEYFQNICLKELSLFPFMAHVRNHCKT